MAPNSGTGRDRLVVAARALTMGQTSGVNAVLIREGRVVAVGQAKELRTRAPDAEVDYHAGATLLPGINDSHIHAAYWGATRPPLALDVSPRAVRSIREIVEAVRRATAVTDRDDWIRGYGWHGGALDELVKDPTRKLTRHDLDAAAPDHPVALYDVSHHAVWVNSKALEVAGVDASTPTPPGSDIPRDLDGIPVGVLAEWSAQDLVGRHMPALAIEDRKAAIRQATVELHRLGITSITEPGLGPAGGTGPMGIDSLHAYEELKRDGELGLRVNVLLLLGAEGTGTAADVADGLERIVVQTDDERWLRQAGIKIFADGIPPLKTAWLSEPYACSDWHGALVIPGADHSERVAELTEMVRLAHVANQQVGVHACGDAAVDAVVAAFVGANKIRRRADARHYVIHGDLVSGSTLALMAQHRIALNVQPQIKTDAADGMSEFIGAERASYQWPNRLSLDVGVPMAFASDAPVCFPDWREGVAAAVSRRSRLTGVVDGPEHRVEFGEALRAYTVGGARQDFAEDWKGRLEVGYVADICVLGADLRDLGPEGLPQVPIVATYVDGDPVYTA